MESMNRNRKFEYLLVCMLSVLRESKYSHKMGAMLLQWSGFCSLLAELLELFVPILETIASEAASLGFEVNWQKTKVQALGCREDMPNFNHQGSGPGRHGSRGVCLPWLSYPLINRKHLWHQPPKCHHSCCHAELRKSDLEVTARHLDEVEAVQHVHLTNIPVWFGLLGDV